VRFLQLFLVVFYCASGIAKAEGDWLRQPLVMWSHLHDSYQTAITFALASHLPGWFWTISQGLVLAFEVLAPLWFALPRTRNVALAFAITMHVGIALMFGPVVWFAILMMAVLVTAFLPERLFAPLETFALGATVIAAACPRRSLCLAATARHGSGSSAL
jgi:Vitamin K-dependent gamma-carboxylase